MKKLLLVLLVGATMASCHTTKHIVGKGSQTGVTQSKKQHNFIGGLVSGDTPSQEEISGKKLENYEIQTQHTFIDGLVGGLTQGLYTPMTITIKEE